MTQQKHNYHSKYASFYNSRRWHELRNQKWCDCDGICELCKKNGIIKEAREIHHIEPIETSWEKRYEYSNLLALCSDCHNLQHSRISPLQKFLKDWDNM